MKNFFIQRLQSILRFLASKMLKKHQPEIIGVTGSVGKSSTKEAIYLVLKQKFADQVWRSAGNLNNELGLPLAILGFKQVPLVLTWPFIILTAFWRVLFWQKYPRSLILEYAADRPGDIYYLTSFARPKIAVITYIGEAHLEFFDSIEQIAAEKANLVRVLPKEGTAILNSDNDYCWRIGLATKSKVLFYGIGEKAEIKASEIKINREGSSFNFSYQKQKRRIHLKVVGKHQVYAALVALAVGINYQIRLDLIVKSLEKYQPPAGRDCLIQGINNSLIIDSSYNANLTSAKAALETLKTLRRAQGKGRKIAILGDMLELGKISNKAHQEIGKLAKQVADKVIAVGSQSKAMKSNKWFGDSGEAANFLVDKIEKNDIILIKGSHAIKMEKIVKKLKIM